MLPVARDDGTPKPELAISAGGGKPRLRGRTSSSYSACDSTNIVRCCCCYAVVCDMQDSHIAIWSQVIDCQFPHRQPCTSEASVGRSRERQGQPAEGDLGERNDGTKWGTHVELLQVGFVHDGQRHDLQLEVEVHNTALIAGAPTVTATLCSTVTVAVRTLLCNPLVQSKL